MSSNDYYNTNPPGFKIKIYVFTTVKHTGPESVAASATRIKIYSWWSTVIRSHFMYLSTESTVLPPGTKTFNIKRGFSF